MIRLMLGFAGGRDGGRLGVGADRRRARQVSRQYDLDLSETATRRRASAARRSSKRDLSSGLSWDEPPFKVTASNITQDKETGIGGWTDEQIKTALRKGERPNGVHLAAIMPADFYEILTPCGDLDSIVAYLRTVKPVGNRRRRRRSIALRRRGNIPPGADKPFTEADMADKVKKGFYLATIGHCFECHTPMGAARSLTC